MNIFGTMNYNRGIFYYFVSSLYDSFNNVTTIKLANNGAYKGEAPSNHFSCPLTLRFQVCPAS